MQSIYVRHYKNSNGHTSQSKDENAATQYCNRLESEFQSAHENKEGSRHHRGYAQKQEKMSGLARSVPQLMRKRTAQKRGRSKFKTELQLHSSLQWMNTRKHKEEKRTCYERKKGTSTIRLQSKSGDITVFRLLQILLASERYKKAVRTCNSNMSSYQRLSTMTLIRTVLLYGSKTWVLTKWEENRFLWEEGSPHEIWPKNSSRCEQPKCHRRREQQ
jgi:hypothetical protein